MSSYLTTVVGAVLESVTSVLSVSQGSICLTAVAGVVLEWGLSVCQPLHDDSRKTLRRHLGHFTR